MIIDVAAYLKQYVSRGDVQYVEFEASGCGARGEQRRAVIVRRKHGGNMGAIL